MLTEHHCHGPAGLAQRLARHIAQRLREAIAARGQALLAVSGGRSPVVLFEQLRVQPLAWAQVTVWLVDERCVPHDHADSNTALVRTHLLQGAAAAARFLPFFDHLPDPLNGAALHTLANTASQRLASSAPGPIDLAVLGMGEDGHTASWFPGAARLPEALNEPGPVTWLCPAPASQASHARLTLTRPALLAARELALPLAGAGKLAVYRQARRAADERLPVSLLLAPPHHPSMPPPPPVSVWTA